MSGPCCRSALSTPISTSGTRSRWSGAKKVEGPRRPPWNATNKRKSGQLSVRRLIRKWFAPTTPRVGEPLRKYSRNLQRSRTERARALHRGRLTWNLGRRHAPGPKPSAGDRRRRREPAEEDVENIRTTLEPTPT